ncbi:MAG: protein kinase [Gloeocapsa sp. UFS-A4-WI-NPMV-4B04]|jgi:serine/threonine-protein kinase|nr:protein kinase [Gloeocapsa sp. UFS-A4-WI-NPMV-4B04]
MQNTALRGRYKIIKLLGSGGFGETYLAEDRDLPNRPICVVKRLQPKSNSPAVLQAKRLFNSEAEVLYRLGNYEQIPRLLAHFEEDQQFYLVQEFIKGHDLSKELTPGKRWSEAQVIEFLEDILKTLEFVHQQKVIHRDIKPANLIRRKQDEKIILIDFGAVKEIETLVANTQGNTHSTIAVGTPGYMPNEQQGGKPRFSSDIYAAGMVAIQGLTGISPEQLPEDTTTGEIIWRQQAQINDRLAAILDKMVRSHFRDRYHSVAEVLSDLHNLHTRTATFVSVQTRQQSSATNIQSQAPQQPVASNVVSSPAPKKQRFVLPAIAVLILGTVGATLYVSRLLSPPQPVSQPIITQATPEASPIPTETPIATPLPFITPEASPSPTSLETPEASPAFSTQEQNTVSLTEIKCLTTTASANDESFVKGTEDVTIGQEVVTPVAFLRGSSNYILSDTPAGVACLLASPDSASQFRKLMLAFGLNNTNRYTGTTDNGATVGLTVYLDKKKLGSKKIIRGEPQSWEIDVTNVQNIALEAECIKPKQYNNSCPSVVFTQAELE